MRFRMRYLALGLALITAGCNWWLYPVLTVADAQEPADAGNPD